MASIHKQHKRPFWFCKYSITGQDGKRTIHFKSTKTNNRKVALEICRVWERTAREGVSGKLTPEAARELVARGVADIYAAINTDPMPTVTVRSWCKDWLQSKDLEASEHTVIRYRGILNKWLKFLATRADRDIATIRPADVLAFRDHEAKLSRPSANLAVKVLRASFNAALKQQLTSTNPATMVDTLKQERGQQKRRAFTQRELASVFAAAKGTEWYGVTMIALYTGARLSDTCRMTWQAVDLKQQVIKYEVGKTRKWLVAPLAPPLVAHLKEIASKGSTTGPLFPKLCEQKAAPLSEGFRRILVAAKLVDPKTHQSTGKGRDKSRTVSELCFHSLRHSFVSILKATGASEAVAMALAGHETRAVSQNYTHLDNETLKAALAKLPDVTIPLADTVQ